MSWAFSYQDRLLSLTISSNSFGVRDGEIAKAAAFIRPEGWEKMPAEFRELGPSYRAANPAGVKAWMELEHKALIGREYRQTLKNEITQAKLQQLKLPTLLIAGAADMSTPPVDLADDRGRDSEQPSCIDARSRALVVLGAAGDFQSRRARLHRWPVEIARRDQSAPDLFKSTNCSAAPGLHLNGRRPIGDWRLWNWLERRAQGLQCRGRQRRKIHQ